MTDRRAAFLALHHQSAPLLLPNPWDAGSARLFASLGFQALATTSSGAAASAGRTDGSLGRERALAHVAAVVDATDLPVSADLENGFADDPESVADLVDAAARAGTAGLSIEDWDPVGQRMYEHAHAVARVAAAAEAAREAGVALTARAENHIRGRDDLADTLRRLSAFADAGADVVYAPGLTTEADIAAVRGAVDVPINVLAMPGTPDVARLAELGVNRVSVGGAIAWVAYGAAVRAATELRDRGTYGYGEQAASGAAAMRAALG